jgi:hypothetical protein
VWWRRRESNPRPKCVYLRSSVNAFALLTIPPDGYLDTVAGRVTALWTQYLFPATRPIAEPVACVQGCSPRLLRMSHVRFSC